MLFPVTLPNQPMIFTSQQFRKTVSERETFENGRDKDNPAQKWPEVKTAGDFVMPGLRNNRYTNGIKGPLSKIRNQIYPLPKMAGNKKSL